MSRFSLPSAETVHLDLDVKTDVMIKKKKKRKENGDSRDAKA